MKWLESKIPTLLLVGVSGALMWLFTWIAPGLTFVVPGRSVIPVVLGVTGVLISASGVVSFRRVGTTVNPTKPSSASSLVLTGPYRITRCDVIQVRLCHIRNRIGTIHRLPTA